MAQSFDCAKAQEPVDRAICASPNLRLLDSELATAFAAALKRDAPNADAIRQAQRSWARNRATCLARAHPGGDAASSPEQCLATAYADRLAALAEPPAKPPVVAVTPGSAANTPHEEAAAANATRSPAALNAAVPPAAPNATPSPAALNATPSPGPGTVAASPATTKQPPAGAPAAPTPAAAEFAVAQPATGLPAVADAAGTLDRDRFPTAGETDVLLHVATPGRFALRAASPTGTALQVVDMLTGPGEREGWPGKQDGRIDALLDTGTYKVRAFGDPAATGDTTLSVTPFAAAGPALLAPGYLPVALTLRDLQSRSFWLVVGDDPAPTRIEAAGRSLAALTVWRDGRDLATVPQTTGTIAETPAHPMTDIVLSGNLPPGTYLVTAYGGPKLPWADGVADEPFYLRTGRSADLLAGGVTRQVGVFGSELFDVPQDAARALLILPQPAEAHLSAAAPGADTLTADMAKTDRARAALLDLPAKPATQSPVSQGTVSQGTVTQRPGAERSVTLQAAPGQAFTLRALAAGTAASPGPLGNVFADRPGRYWLAVQEPANGGDELPAAAMLVRFSVDATTGERSGSAEILASPGVPSVGPGQPWRTRFNMRGPSALLFHATGVVTVAVHAEGPALTARITTPEGAVLNATGNGTAATSWALSPGWYTLVLTPKPNAIGILDLTLGPPGLIPPTPAPPGPDAPVLPLGEQAIDAQHRLALLVNREPDASATLVMRRAPVELADGPVVETVPAGAVFALAVHARAAGILAVRDIAAGRVLLSRTIAAGEGTTVTLPAAEQARTVAVALLPDGQSASPEPAPAATLTALQDGQPEFLDLDRGRQASFALTVGQGGLYRVQTTGRLKTAGRIGTSFIPVLGEAAANGVGQNMLLQRYLRAGRYRLDVTAQDSAGHLGVSATETPLAEGAELLPEGSVRATLTPGHGVAFPIRIATAGPYHLDLLGDGRTFTARLEDADGWPLRAAGDLSSIEQDLTPGRYRLIVQPPSVEARVVARLRQVVRPVALTGHGPHPLPFDAPQSLEWREPPGRDDARTPDTWTFALAGPANVSLTVTGDGMGATLVAATADAAAPPLGRLIAGTPFKIALPAGDYRAEARSLGRNDRLDYTIALHSDELQPDVARRVTLPADLPFAIAAPRVVALTSFGRVPLRAELRDGAGHVLARAAGRTDDWNIALSRALPAGRYRLVLAPLAPPASSANSGSDDGASNDASDRGSDSGMGAGQDADNAGQSQASPGQGAGQDNNAQANNDSNGSGAANSNDNDSGQANNDDSGAASSNDNGAASSSDNGGANSSDNGAASSNDSGAASSSDNGGASSSDNGGASSSDNGGVQPNSNDNGQADGSNSSQANNNDNGQANSSDNDAGQANSNDTGQDNAGQAAGDQSAPSRSPARTEITLHLPEARPDVAMPADGAMALTAGGVQHVTLPLANPGSLLVAAAEAPVEQILAVEQQGADDSWRTLGQGQGLAPIVAVPVGDAKAPRRLAVWAVDGGAVPIRVAAHAVAAAPGPIGSVTLAPVALIGITRPWFAAAVADPGGLMLRLEAADPGLLAASVPDQAAEPVGNGAIVAQSEAVWLLSPQQAAPSLAVVQAAAGSLAVAVPADGHATLPLATATGPALCGYVAESGLGQPGLDAGRGMGVAPGSAFALCGGPVLRAWNAGGDAALRLRLRRADLAVQPDVAAVDQSFAGLLPPHAAVKLALPAGVKRLDVSLAAGAALVAGWQQATAVTAWSGDTALSRSLTGDWADALLVNTGDAPVPAALSVTSAAAAPSLAPGAVFRRFFGAGGSFVLPLTAQPGQRLTLAGDATATVLRPDGQVRQGRVIDLDGPAQAVVTHGAGPLALWIEGAGVSPWPATPPRDVALPARVTLTGDAMALHLSPGAPVLLRLSGTAPAIVAVGNDPPVLFAKGVATARYLPAGDTLLHILAPQDGPLSGSLELSGTPVVQESEGVGTPVAIAPGGAAVFGFSVAAAGLVGLGVRADPDRVDARLLDEHGVTLARGVSMLRQLAPGHYLLEASVPPDAPTTLVRPALLGTVPHPNPPPAEVIRGLLLAAGFAPPNNAR
jgi:uncharacterized protein